MARDLMKKDLYTSVEVGQRKTEKRKISEYVRVFSLCFLCRFLLVFLFEIIVQIKQVIVTVSVCEHNGLVIFKPGIPPFTYCV